MSTITKVGHTRGPWKAHDEYWSAERKAKTGYVDIRGADGSWLVRLQKGPDAQLIAAAPELLKALRTLVSMIDEDTCKCAEQSWYGEGHVTDCPLDYLAEAEAVIAKAGGRD